jgi:transcriptional regulator with XRE-family HTH domain
MGTPNVDLAGRLAAWRARSGLTLQEVADASGVSKQTLSYLECGEQHDLGVCKLSAVAKALRTDLLTFLGPLPKQERAA